MVERRLQFGTKPGRLRLPEEYEAFNEVGIGPIPSGGKDPDVGEGQDSRKK